MAKFNKKDQIEHPNYGRGEILNVTRGSGALFLLDVEFPDCGIRKQLSSLWVEQHCQHITRRQAEEAGKPQFRSGEYHLEPALSNDNWQVYLEKDTPMSRELCDGLDYMLRCIRPGVNFVVIGPYAAVLMFPKEASSDQQIEKAAKKHMTGVFRQHPDFGCTENEDGSVVVTMREAALCFFLPPERVEKDTRGKPSLKCLLEGRNRLLEACYNAKMYAIVRSAPTGEQAAEK